MKRSGFEIAMRVCGAILFSVLAPYIVYQALKTSPDFLPASFALAGMPRLVALIPIATIVILIVNVGLAFWRGSRPVTMQLLGISILILTQFVPAINRKAPDTFACSFGLAVPVVVFLWWLLRLEKVGEPLVMGEREKLESMAVDRGLIFVDLDRLQIEARVLQLLRPSTMRQYSIVPVRADRNNLYIATKDVNDVVAQDAARVESGMRIIPVVAIPDSIDAMIEKLSETPI